MQSATGDKVKASNVSLTEADKTPSEDNDDEEFSPVGLTEADLQNEGLQLQGQDWSDPAVSIVDNDDVSDDVDADDDIIRAEAAMAEMSTALTAMKMSAASGTADESVLAEDNEISNGTEQQGSDEEDDEEDADERELMMKLIKARAVHIINAAREGKFEPRGGLAALTEQVRTNRLFFVRGFNFIF